MYFPNEPNNTTDPMALLMGDSFDRELGETSTRTKIPEVDRGYDFDIVVGGKNATFFE